MQENPKYLVQMLKKLTINNLDIVFTKRKTRNFPFLKNITAHLYKKLIDLISDSKFSPYDPHTGTMTLMKSKVRDKFVLIEDKHRHYIMLMRWLGFKSETLEIDHEKRKRDKSSYSFLKLITHAIDGIVSQSYKPLLISVYLGFFIVFLSIILCICLISYFFLYGFKEGWLSIIIFLITFFAGFNMFFLGLNGLYLGKNFEETRTRPLYIESERINFK